MNKPTRPANSRRRRVFQELDPKAHKGKGLSRANLAICIAIVLSVLVAMLETEPVVAAGHHLIFLAIEAVFTTLFLIEYLVRLWICVEDPRFADGWRGRLRYALTPMAIMDLLALAPLLLTLGGTSPFLLRLFRFIRILRLARLGRFSKSIQIMGQALRRRRYELILSGCIAVLLLMASSTLLYLAEASVQPEAFGSIPRAMWWSVATLTTVGYGDVYPITGLGRLLAAVTALTGIGLIAVPTGILAASFSDVLHENRKADGAEDQEPD
ncbi:MAG: ion transporter [Kiloniellales bacterium]